MGWDAEARRLRAQGHDTGEIATKLGQAPEVIRAALRGIARPEAEAVFGAGQTLVERHTPRVPRVTLDRQALPSGAAAFARGEIDRAELMRRISR
jgi:hypothetical protein